MSVEQRDRAWYLRELEGNECLCGRASRPRYSFCVRCYRALPAELRNPLWRWIGHGYEEAFEAAAKWLKENVW